MTPQREKHIQMISGVLFFLYLTALIYFLFFADEYGRGAADQMRYNFVPFAEIRRFLVYRGIIGTRAVLLNVYGNIIGFLPFGLFLPLLHRYFRKLPRTIAVCCLFSCAVELIQLVTRRGSCDIDDVILNTLGGLLGYGFFRICSALRRRLHRADRKNPEAPGGVGV